jgi:hypothetical protein
MCAIEHIPFLFQFYDTLNLKNKDKDYIYKE